MTKQPPPTDYLAASLDDGTTGGLPLTPHSTASDTAGLIEILRLITDPAALKKRLAELQRMSAEVDRKIDEAAQREIELKKQVEDLALRRAEFDRQLEIDRANHVAKTEAEKQAMADKLKQAEQFFANLNIRSDPHAA
jgi:septal ring factor EnvC (AmiA/AmiB activator)